MHLGDCVWLEEDFDCVPNSVEDRIVVQAYDHAQSFRVVVGKNLRYAVTEFGIARWQRHA